MATRDQHQQALDLVRWLTEDCDVTPQQVLRQRPLSPTSSVDRPAIDVRDDAAFLLRVAGGWTYRDIAGVFAAFRGHTAARKAVRRAEVDDGRVAEARRVLWRNV